MESKLFCSSNTLEHLLRLDCSQFSTCLWLQLHYDSDYHAWRASRLCPHSSEGCGAREDPLLQGLRTRHPGEARSPAGTWSTARYKFPSHFSQMLFPFLHYTLLRRHAGCPARSSSFPCGKLQGKGAKGTDQSRSTLRHKSYKPSIFLWLIIH